MAENGNEIKDFRQESCGSCGLKSVCKQTEEGCFTRGQRWKAIMLAYLVPLVIVIGTVVGCSYWQAGDTITAVSTLGVIAVYYFLLWLRKPKV